MSSVVDIQFSYTHPCNSDDLLLNLNWLGIHAFCMTLYCITHSIIDYTELQPPIAIPLHHFMRNLSSTQLWVYTLSQYCCDIINMVLKPWRDEALFFKNMNFDISCMQNWAKAQIPTLHQKHKVYHLIPQVKEFFINLSLSIMLGVMKTWSV